MALHGEFADLLVVLDDQDAHAPAIDEFVVVGALLRDGSSVDRRGADRA